MKSLCLTVPIKFVGEPFCVSNDFWYRKVSSKRGGKLHGFVDFFLSHRTETKNFVQEPFCFPETFWYRKKILWIGEGLSRFSAAFFMSHSAENFHRGILLFLRTFLVSSGFMDEKGGITFFRLKFSVSQCRKTLYMNPLVFH